jgi:hypothetical protein
MNKFHGTEAESHMKEQPATTRNSSVVTSNITYLK